MAKIHRWSLDETTGLLADSIGTANGTASNMSSAAALFGNGRQADSAAGYIDVGDPSDLHFTTGAFSIRVILKVAADTVDDRILISRWNHPPSQKAWALIVAQSDDGTIPNELYLTVSSTGADEPEYTSGYSINDDAWHDVVVTRSGQTYRMYVDGVLVSEELAGLSAIFDATGNTYIGNAATFGNGSQGIIIDQIEIWDEELTAAYVAGMSFADNILLTNLAPDRGQKRWPTEDDLSLTISSPDSDIDMSTVVITLNGSVVYQFDNWGLLFNGVVAGTAREKIFTFYAKESYYDDRIRLTELLDYTVAVYAENGDGEILDTNYAFKTGIHALYNVNGRKALPYPRPSRAPKYMLPETKPLLIARLDDNTGFTDLSGNGVVLTPQGTALVSTIDWAWSEKPTFPILRARAFQSGYIACDDPSIQLDQFTLSAFMYIGGSARSFFPTTNYVYASSSDWELSWTARFIYNVEEQQSLLTNGYLLQLHPVHNYGALGNGPWTYADNYYFPRGTGLENLGKEASFQRTYGDSRMHRVTLVVNNDYIACYEDGVLLGVEDNVSDPISYAVDDTVWFGATRVELPEQHQEDYAVMHQNSKGKIADIMISPLYDSFDLPNSLGLALRDTAEGCGFDGSTMALYTFSNDTAGTVYDRTGAGVDGAVTGTVPLVAGPVSWKSRYFDGLVANYVTVADHPDLATIRSVEIWFTPEDLTAGTLVDKGTQFKIYNEADGTFIFSMFDGVATRAVSVELGDVRAGLLYYLAAVLDPDNLQIKIHVNGEVSGVTTFASFDVEAWKNNDDMLVGVDSGLTTAFKGHVHEIRLSDVVRSNLDIYNQYNATGVVEEAL